MGFYKQLIHISLGLLSHQKNVSVVFCELPDQKCFSQQRDSFNMMISISTIQSKIHKSNGFLKQRTCFHRFYFNLFFTSKYFLSRHNSKKQLHIFFLSETVVNIFSEAAARSLKYIEIFLEVASHKKYQLHSFCTKYTLSV